MTPDIVNVTDVAKEMIGVELLLGGMALLFLCRLLWTGFRLRRQRALHLKYRLCSTRDGLIQLVVQGLVREENEAFQFCYRLVNLSVKYIHQFRLPALLAALKESRKEDPDLERIMLTIERHPQMKYLMKQYLDSMLAILEFNSRVVRTVVFIARRPLLRGLTMAVLRATRCYPKLKQHHEVALRDELLGFRSALALG